MTSNFQIETQELLNWCWAAVAATVSHYFHPGQSLTQCSIANTVLATDCCAGVQPLAACDQQADLTTALGAINATDQPLPNQILPFETIQAQIDAGRPICARIQWFGESSGHFVILSGYSVSTTGDLWVDVSDPYFQDSTVPYDSFVSAYLGAGEWSDTYLVSPT